MNNIRKIIEERLENAQIDLKCNINLSVEDVRVLQGQIEAYQDCLNLIQDLERLKKLENENKELRKNVKELEDLYLNENKHWCETMDSLRKENENLKEKLNGIPPEYDGYLYFSQSISNIVKENEKLNSIIKENFAYYPDALFEKVCFKWTVPVMEDEIIEVLGNEMV